MAEKLTHWDPVDHLQTSEGVAQARGLSQLARDAGISREDLGRAASPTGNPSSLPC